MKKLLFSIIGFLSTLHVSFAQEQPGIGGPGLPGNNSENGASGDFDNSAFDGSLDNLTSYLIQVVAVIAVLALMISGVMLIISGGEEERFKKAKTWFVWSLAGVLVSLTAWFMINFLNNLSIGI